VSTLTGEFFAFALDAGTQAVSVVAHPMAAVADVSAFCKKVCAWQQKKSRHFEFLSCICTLVSWSVCFLLKFLLIGCDCIFADFLS
jgi:hypothetical protein